MFEFDSYFAKAMHQLFLSFFFFFFPSRRMLILRAAFASASPEFLAPPSPENVRSASISSPSSSFLPIVIRGGSIWRISRMAAKAEVEEKEEIWASSGKREREDAKDKLSMFSQG